MRLPNPFAEAETLTIVESSPHAVRIPATVRAVSIRPDPGNSKAKPRLDDIDAVIAQLPSNTIELIDIDYNCNLSRLPCLEQQTHIRYAHLGALKIRDHSPIFTLTRLESLFLVSTSLTSLAAFRDHPFKYVRLIRGGVTSFDISATSVFLQNCTKLMAFGNVTIASLILESCRRVDLTSLANVRGLRRLQLLAPASIASAAPLLDCKSLESIVITATPLSKVELGLLSAMPSLKWMFLSVGDARIAKVAEELPKVLITNGNVCFRDNRSLPPQQYYRELKAAGSP